MMQVEVRFRLASLVALQSYRDFPERVQQINTANLYVLKGTLFDYEHKGSRANTNPLGTIKMLIRR